MKPVHQAGRAGFSVIEGLGYLLVTGLMMGALTYAMGSLFRNQAHPAVRYQNQVYASAPSFPQFRTAVDLHAALTRSIDQADNVLLIGGVRSHPIADPDGPSPALDLTFHDTALAQAAVADPMHAYSSWDLLQDNARQFAPYLTARNDAADFTLLTLQGQQRITSITQQRRHTATINGEALVLYEVTYQAVDWSSGAGVMTPNADTGSLPTAEYRLYLAAAEDRWARPPGAMHYWYRTDPSWNRDQEGPSRLIFADPYALTGADALAKISALSRFVYFLPVLR
jgi:hypothetical protein